MWYFLPSHGCSSLCFLFCTSQGWVKKPSDSAMAHYNLGVVVYDDGQCELAITEFKEAVDIAPKYADAHYNLGAVYQNKGLLKEAIAEYHRVIDLAPDSVDAYYNLGVIYTQLNSFEKAVLAFQEALRNKPDYKEAQQGLEKAVYLKQYQR